ncbi:DUF4244 domain-containing protein [Nocardiopsis ansamitocini]|uniref:DUF4244 domain-containing protein n=1 Tax=Nocardiopsis ansamitocini TaxID=1670832 RepID=A0A9W6P4X0_9ACTN|nr:DUF4244 domain-containing protein [Nocardiopsis ansamitocini]GLU47216.1 hypothetical protein Nans01_15670 [Nocardiopsis ansamitocini]
MSAVTVLLHRLLLPVRTRERGMATAEYALATVTACAFAAVLYLILTSSEVRDTLTTLVTGALQVGG